MGRLRERGDIRPWQINIKGRKEIIEEIDRTEWDKMDPGIRDAVKILRDHGVETFESCQGGEGHIGKYPWIRFLGDRHEGYRVITICAQHGFLLKSISRVYGCIDNEVTEVDWRVEFWEKPYWR
jgi:hypothetical protein